ncbi:MAG: MarR family transcriptional regulator [Promethearchaeota archaeon]
MSEIVFDPEVFLIEDEILNLLESTPMFAGRDPYFIKILGLFMTRKHLTQKTLQRITGLSAGKVSEELNRFLEMKLIEKEKISEKGKLIYTAESAGLILLKFSKSILSRMIKWEEELVELREELEKNKEILENEKGYNQLVKLYNYFADAVMQYKKSFKAIDDEIK